MGRTVAIGIQSFEDVRKSNYFYIDKTSFIKISGNQFVFCQGERE